MPGGLRALRGSRKHSRGFARLPTTHLPAPDRPAAQGLGLGTPSLHRLSAKTPCSILGCVPGFLADMNFWGTRSSPQQISSFFSWTQNSPCAEPKGDLAFHRFLVPVSAPRVRRGGEGMDA